MKKEWSYKKVVRWFSLGVLIWAMGLLQAEAQTKCRVLVTTDVHGTEPDDLESVVRLLLYSNEYDIEGVIAVTGEFAKDPTVYDPTQAEMLVSVIDAYEACYNNLTAHADGFPTAAYLRSITKVGLETFNMETVGDGNDTDGTRLIESVLTSSDPRPIYIGLWGGGNSLAQALWDLRNEKTSSEMNAIVAKMRVFDIGGQDNAGAWMAKTWPEMIFLRSQIQFFGMSQHYLNSNNNIGDLGYTTKSWIANNVQSHGQLGAAYPTPKYIMEGDSPAFMYVIRNGLSDPEYWWHGGWGGRFNNLETKNVEALIWVNSSAPEDAYKDYYMYNNASDDWTFNGTTYTGDAAKKAALSRWRPAFQNDMAARMDWSINGSYGGANHNPVAICNGSSGLDYVPLNATPGSTVQLSAAGSSDPDGDALSYNWWYYKEPGTYSGSVTVNNSNSQKASVLIPTNAQDKEIHIILEVKDNGSPNLTSYRRVIINVESGFSDVDITNPSFEEPGTGKIPVTPGGDWSVIPGWTGGAENANEAGVDENSDFATDGDYFGYLGTDASIYQLTDHEIAIGESFTLTADVSSTWKAIEGIDMALYYDNAGSQVSMGVKNYMFEIGPGNDGPYEHSLTVEADDVTGSIGNIIGIRFSTTDAWVGVDNVRLVVESTIATGIDFLGAEAVTMYPNPVEDVLNIASSDVTNIEIFNISGKLVKRVQLNGSPVNVSELDNGIYLVKLIGSTTAISKFIKR